MGYLYSDKNGGQTFSERRSRFEEAGAAGDNRFRGAETSLRSVMSELEDVKLEPLPLNSKLKKTGLSGYRRSSVEAYVEELKRTTSQLKDNMEQQIQSLSAECMRLKSESQVLRGQIVQAEEQTSQVKDMLVTVTNQRDAADAELRTMEDRVSFYETENARTEELKSSLRQKTEELNSAAAENSRLKEQIKDFSGKINRINDEFLKYKNRKTAESEEIDRLTQQVNSLRENNDALKTELDAAKQELSEKAEREPEKAETRFHEENIELMRKFSDLYAEYKKELARGDSLTKEKEAMSELLEEYQKKERGNAILRQKDKEQRETIEAMQTVINGLLDEAQHQQEAYERLSAERSENKELLYNLTRENSNLQVQNVELLDKNEELSTRVSKLEAEKAKLEKQTPSTTVIPLFHPEQTEAADSAAEDPFSETMKKLRNRKSYNM